MKTVAYKNYVGSAEIDIEAGVCTGKILFINDLVTYQAESPRQLQAEFEAAVDDYLETCKLVGKDPEKAFSGVFNVRVSPEDHRRATVASVQENKSLNAIMAEALHSYLNWRERGPHKVEHHHLVEIEVKRLSTLMAGASETPTWMTLTGHHQNAGEKHVH